VSANGGRREGFLEVAQRLYATGGVAVFWDGLGPKLVRAVVNHSVTFFVFEQVTSAYAAANI